MPNTETNKTDNQIKSDGEQQSLIKSIIQLIADIEKNGDEREFDQIKEEESAKIDKHLNPLNFDDRLKIKDEFKSKESEINSNGIVSKLLFKHFLQTFESAISRIRLSSEIKKATEYIHNIGDEFYAANSNVEKKKNGWFKNIDVERKIIVVNFLKKKCKEFANSLSYELCQLNEEIKGKENA